jgi:hypothetical protein
MRSINLEAKIKITQVVRRFGQCGGMESYVFHLTRALDELGVKVAVLCEEICNDPPKSVDIVCLNKPLIKPSWLSLLLFSREVGRFYKKNNLFLKEKHKKMKKQIITTLLFIVLANAGVNAQVGIGVSTANLNPSAQLEVSSTNKGLLPPRMTTVQRNAIANPAAGLIIYNLTTHVLEYYREVEGWTSFAISNASTTTTTGRNASTNNP